MLLLKEKEILIHSFWTVHLDSSFILDSSIWIIFILQDVNYDIIHEMEAKPSTHVYTFIKGRRYFIYNLLKIWQAGLYSLVYHIRQTYSIFFFTAMKPPLVVNVSPRYIKLSVYVNKRKTTKNSLSNSPKFFTPLVYSLGETVLAQIGWNTSFDSTYGSA